MLSLQGWIEGGFLGGRDGQWYAKVIMEGW